MDVIVEYKKEPKKTVLENLSIEGRRRMPERRELWTYNIVT